MTASTAPRFLVAAPSYWERWGEPAEPHALARHACLHYGETAGGSTWQFRQADGRRESVSVNGPICSNNGDLLLQAALSGVGLTVLPEFLLRDALQAGQLRRAMPDWQVFPDIGLFALYAPATKGMPAVRAFVEHLQRHLSL
jgi:DNA-binding transcriptional LysR family regulator